MRFACILGSLLATVIIFANPADSIRSEQREEGLFVVHEVEEEETIYSLAKRYESSISSIIKHNQIIDNRIEIGQIIYILINDMVPDERENDQPSATDAALEIHRVEPGETLYSISKKYDIRLKDLRKWNNLQDNNISPGMPLKLSREAKIEMTEEANPLASTEVSEELADDSLAVVEENPFADFERYLVQTGETLSTIAGKIGVSMDSLKFWNGLESDYLKIGQRLFFRPSDDVEITSISEPKKKLRTQIDENGFERMYEEGVASVIQSMKTTRYLALHRTLPIGTNLEVRNLMNNQIVYVKVVGKLPNTGLNKNLLLRLSQPAFDQLGILDSKSRVEVSYNKQ